MNKFILIALTSIFLSSNLFAGCMKSEIKQIDAKLENSSISEAKKNEVIKLRDDNFIKYHNHKPFLDKIEKKFGKTAAQNIVEMSKIKLKRKILGDQL